MSHIPASVVYAARVVRTAELIRSAEKDLGTLTDGQRRDLLMDNTNWDSGTIRGLVSDYSESTKGESR